MPRRNRRRHAEDPEYVEGFLRNIAKSLMIERCARLPRSPIAVEHLGPDSRKPQERSTPGASTNRLQVKCRNGGRYSHGTA